MKLVVYLLFAAASLLAEPSHRAFVTPSGKTPTCPFVLSLLGTDYPDVLPFTREILTSGEDTAPTLVAQDYLDDKGYTPARTQFARLQIELDEMFKQYQARSVQELPPELQARAFSLELRTHLLITGHGKTWVPQIPYVRKFEFRRGVLYGAEVDIFDLLENGKSVDEHLKMLHVFGIKRVDIPPLFFPLPDLPAMLAFEELSVLNYGQASLLGQLPSFRNIKRFDLRGATVADIVSLDRTPYLAQAEVSPPVNPEAWENVLHNRPLTATLGPPYSLRMRRKAYEHWASSHGGSSEESLRTYFPDEKERETVRTFFK